MEERSQDYLDYRELPIEEYLRKYHQYSQPESLWSGRGTTHSKFVNALESHAPSSILFFEPRGVTVQEVKDFINTITQDNVFPEDLIHFFAFLKYCGFFAFYRISFYNWIHRKDWIHPNSDWQEEPHTIHELIEAEFGDEFLRSRLQGLIYWSIPGNS